MKLLIFPLIFLIVFSMLSWLGVGSTVSNPNSTLYDPQGQPSHYEGWYDANGHMVCYNNLTTPANGENGIYKALGGEIGIFALAQKQYLWINATGTWATSYPIYNTPNGTNQEITQGQGFDLNTTLGIIAAIGAVMIFATVAGLRILGNGLSDVSVQAIIKGSALTTIWLIFSVVSMALITQVPIFGPVFYFFLTIIYTLGIINQIGSGVSE